MKRSKPKPTLKSRQALFDQLPELGKRVVETRSATAALPYAQWIKLLKILDKLDRECEAGRKAANRTGLLLILPTAAFAATAFAFPPLLALALLSAIPMTFFFVRAGKFAKYDHDNRLRLFLLPLLVLLKGDIPRNAVVSIALKMDRIDSNPYKVREAPTPVYGNTISGKDHFYRQEWMVLDMRLSDGTAVQVKMLDAMRVRKVKKRSMSGKIKFKTKKKTKRTFRVAAKFSKEVYKLFPGGDVSDQTDKYLVVKQKTTQVLAKDKNMPKSEIVLNGISRAYSQVIPK